MNETGNREQGIGSSETEFEKALTRALRPVNAPETLAKFLALAAEAEEQRKGSGKRWLWWKPASGGRVLVLPRMQPFPMWMSGAVAAVVVLAAFVGQQAHVRHERTRATAEFETATRIEEQALEHTRRQLQRAGVPLD